jgi:hypothetical protein
VVTGKPNKEKLNKYGNILRKKTMTGYSINVILKMTGPLKSNINAKNQEL